MGCCELVWVGNLFDLWGFSRLLRAHVVVSPGPRRMLLAVAKSSGPAKIKLRIAPNGRLIALGQSKSVSQGEARSGATSMG
jgi:hypothetical protein